MKTYKQAILIILDGWGYREDKEHNAIAEAKTPFFDYLWQRYSPTLLNASGEHVGLPEGQMGNSEIGHMTIGAGKVIDTDLVRLSKAAKAGDFSRNEVMLQLFNHVKKHDSVLHVMGLIGPGGIHSHSDHLYAFLKSAKEFGLTKIAIDAFTDGRDTPPQSASGYLAELEKVLSELGVGRIASVSGRFYAMDRDNNWDRLAKAEEVIFNRTGKTVEGVLPSEYLRDIYLEGVYDEQVMPVVFAEGNDDIQPIAQNDGVFFFNFRADRTRMLSQKIIDQSEVKNLFFVTLTEYDKNFSCAVAFKPLEIETTLAKEISKAGMTQAHIAETEKFAHATYFLNGGQQEPHIGEEHILLSSYKDIQTHDEKPEMRAEAIADKAIEQIEKGTNFIFINFANADMVGHTANYPAIIKGVEEVDRQLKRVVEAAEAKGAVVFVTADHGNAEVNVDSVSGERHTAHTTNLVPAILTVEELEIRQGSLADIAPTLLELLNLDKPKEMTGKSLFEEVNIDSKT